MFNKNEDMNLEPKAKKHFSNKKKMKYGTYAIVISAIVIAVAVAVNVLFGVLAKRTNLDIDLSAEKQNTLTAENIAFLETVDVPVTLTVCGLSEDSYVSYMDSYSGFNMSENSAAQHAEYYKQTVRFLELYEIYCENVTVEFVDTQHPKFETVLSEFTTTDINYGSIIVSATHMVDGTEVKRNAVVNFDDIYALQNLYAGSMYEMMGAPATYMIRGNNFESAVSGAIRKVAATKTNKVGVITTHCTKGIVDYLDKSVLSINNFEVEEISDKIIETIPEDYTLIIIAAPTEDFAQPELDAISDWLDNHGQRGRGLLFFASASSPELPNLYGFLEEWGIEVGDKVLFDTNKSSYVAAAGPSTMYFTNTTETDNDIVKPIVNGTRSYIISSPLEMNVMWETEGSRDTYVPILTYSSEVAAAPKGSTAEWKPSDDDILDQRPGVIVTCDELWENNEAKRSYVVAFSSSTFITQGVVEYFNSKGNLYATLNTANLIAGVEEDSFAFIMRQMEAQSYTVSEQGAKAIQIIFQWGLPVLLIAFGIVVFVRRIRR